MGFIYDFFAWVMRLCYKLIPNYAAALLLFALVFKILFLPFGIKQQKNLQKQASLRPKEMAIRNKYKGRNDRETQAKVQQEVQMMYQKEGFNPMGGCLPLLLQLPLIFGLYRVIRYPLRYLCQFSEGTVRKIGQVLHSNGWLTSAPNDKTADIEFAGPLRDHFADVQAQVPDLQGVSVDILPDFKLFSLNLEQNPSWSSWLVIIPILVLVTQFFSMKLTRKFSYQPPMQEGSDAAKSLAIMDIMMPLMSLWFAFIMPALLGVYWIYQSILGVGQQYLLSKIFPPPVFTEEDYKEAERQLKGKAPKRKGARADDPDRPYVRSLHRIDEDEWEKPEPKKTGAKGGAKKSAATPKPKAQAAPKPTPTGNAAKLTMAPLKEEPKRPEVTDAAAATESQPTPTDAPEAPSADQKETKE